MKDHSVRIAALNKAEFEKLSRECFITLLAFLESIPKKENERIDAAMRRFGKQLDERYPIDDPKKFSAVVAKIPESQRKAKSAAVLMEYYQTLMNSINPPYRAFLQEQLRETIENTLKKIEGGKK